MITVDDYLMNRKSGLTFELLENASDTSDNPSSSHGSLKEPG
jgi:hypothetical protein